MKYKLICLKISNRLFMKFMKFRKGKKRYKGLKTGKLTSVW